MMYVVTLETIGEGSALMGVYDDLEKAVKSIVEEIKVFEIFWGLITIKVDGVTIREGKNEIQWIAITPMETNKLELPWLE